MMTFSTMDFIVTLDINDIQHNDAIIIESHYAESCIFLLLCWMSLYSLSLCQATKYILHRTLRPTLLAWLPWVSDL